MGPRHSFSDASKPLSFCNGHCRGEFVSITEGASLSLPSTNSQPLDSLTSCGGDGGHGRLHPGRA
eukprot:m.429133 g.429133  ORF g.429133 m.429133 type:complete len:65 (-) comp16961_c0_seq1:5611-5805(-)